MRTTVEHASVTTLAELSIPAIFILPRATATSVPCQAIHRCSGLGLALARGKRAADLGLRHLVGPLLPATLSSDMPFRVIGGSRSCPLGLFAAPVAPRGPTSMSAASTTHPSNSAWTPLRHSKYKATYLPRASAPAPGFGPQPSSPSTMRTIHHSARFLSHGKPA